MQGWIIATVCAGGGLLVVVIVLMVYLCRRIMEKRGTTSTTWPSVEETSAFLATENVLERFILFQLNFFSLTWSLEHDITHTRRFIVSCRRFLNIGIVFLGLFAIDIVDVIWRNWCCYPVGTSLNNLNQGTCDNENAAVQQIASPCDSMDSWMWNVNVAFVASIVLSLGLHVYLSYNFVTDVRTGLEGNYVGLVDVLDSHSDICTPAQIKRFKKYTWWTFEHHRSLGRNSSFVPREIHLKRLSILFLDPFAIFFGYPHIVMARSDLAIANFFLIAVFTGMGSLYFLWAKPIFDQTCCFYEGIADGSFGYCDDLSASIVHDPFRLPCHGQSITMIVLIVIMIACVLIIFGLWFYSFLIFHYLVHRNTVPYIQKLSQVSYEHRKQANAWFEKSPPPDYANITSEVEEE